MSNTPTARGRKEWMPNRMFDPVSNPFAIQNLLEKKVETFVEHRDELPDSGFAFDPVVMANPVHAFAEQTMEDPASEAMQAFQAEWMDAGNEFAGNEAQATADFVGDPATSAGAASDAGFQAEGSEASQETVAGAAAPAGRHPQDQAPVMAANTTDTADAGQSAAGEPIAGAEASANPHDEPTAHAEREGTQARAADADKATLAGDASAQDLAEAAAAQANDGDPSGAMDADGEHADTVHAEAVPTEAVHAGSADSVAAASADHAVAGASSADNAAHDEPVANAMAVHAEDASSQDAEAVRDEAAHADAAVNTDHAAPVAAGHSGMTEEALNARLEAAREEGRAEVRVSAHQQGFDMGYEAGVAKTREDFEQQSAEKLAQLQSVIDALQQLSYNPDALFEPMKKLIMHLAEQLVRGELSQSPQAISRLVDNCLRELNASGEKAVIIHLNPEDLELYKPQAAQFGDAILLRADPKLERGSVRASLEGSVVEDLIQRRIAGLKKGLSQAAAPSWRAGNARLSERIADGQRGSQHVEDVTATSSANLSSAATATTTTAATASTEAAAAAADHAGSTAADASDPANPVVTADSTDA